MKLNHDCVRDLLLSIEEENNLTETLTKEKLEQLPRLYKYRSDDLVYTIERLIEANFINGSCNRFDDGESIIVLISSITYTGHEFLDTIRDSDVWKETKNISKKVSSASLSMLSSIATSYLSKKLGL